MATQPLDTLMAPDWAEALAPVEPAIRAMGEFLRAEVTAGRGYLPAGEHVLRAFQRPLADARVLIVGQDPYPTPGHAVGLSFSVAPEVRPIPGRCRTSTPNSPRISGCHARPRATSPDGRTAASCCSTGSSP